MKKKQPKNKTEDPIKNNGFDEANSLTGLDLFNFLIEGPEVRVREESSKERQEKEFEKLALLGASKVSIDAVKNFLLFTAKAYKVTFPQEFYKEMFRLKGWSYSGANVYRKPWLVAKYTVEVIYGRFTKDIIIAIQSQNPYIMPGVRRFKYFQYLNEQGQTLLEQFIQEAIAEMKVSTTWYEFRLKMFEKYKLPYQTELFN